MSAGKQAPRAGGQAGEPLLKGKSHPLGATVTESGVNFSVYSRHATGVELLLFDDVDDRAPARVLELDPLRNRTDDYWHAALPGAGAGLIYGWRVQGPFEPESGHRFDGQKVLLDPYARAVVTGAHYSREAARRPGPNLRESMKAVVADLSTYDWEGDEPLHRPYSQTVIYEMHVRGFTRHPSSGLAPQLRGTYAGLIEKIPYLVDLGITAVELLPVLQFDEQDATSGLTNYWGYSPVSFLAPHAAYASCRDPLAVLDEFRDMVKALHRAGLEVILDVVYNHTAENDHNGPTFSLRGLANRAYYILDENEARYADYTGCGNTLNTNHSVVRRMILDSLRHWVTEMHVDGFRFDLASVLARDPSGQPVEDPPILWAIDTIPELAGTKLIAEAWDASGLYQVGSFVGSRWKEWNGRFRDDVRRFLRGDADSVSAIGQRFLASPDIYGHRGRGPEQSINFVTCHDGFTLNDLVSYEHKHNAANGLDNTDGTRDNLSANYGVEGPTEDPEIEAIRSQQVKNFLTLTLLALGTPMILMGDEMRNTQDGNNNAYCQDNELSWLDWGALVRHADVHAFVRQLIGLRLHLDVVGADNGPDLETLLKTAEIRWHGVRLDEPDWSESSRSLAFSARNPRAERGLYVMLSSSEQPLEFELPAVPKGMFGWQRLVDTSCAPPGEVRTTEDAPLVEGASYRLAPRSIVVLSAATRTS